MTLVAQKLLLVSWFLLLAGNDSDAQDIVITRTVPDPASQALPCPGQSVEYKCQQMVPSIELQWRLPNNEELRFAAGFDDVGSTASTTDGNILANITAAVTDTEDDRLFLFTSTLMILETVNGMMLSCTGGTTENAVENDTVVIFSGNPDYPMDLTYNDKVIIVSSVYLVWNRPIYTGGDGVTVDEYTVSANGQSETVSDSSEVVSYTSTGLIYGEVLVTAINSCGQESQPTSITIPASAPPDITGHTEEFSCNASLNQFPVTISWMPGARSEGVVYPGEVLVNVELQSQLDTDSIVCSVETNTSCTAIITRDVLIITGDASTDTTVTREIYTFTVTQTNDVDSIVNMSSFDASVLFITDVMLDADDDPLSVTVEVNGLCPDGDYDVLVTFGTRPGTGSDSDCEGQVDMNTTISSGDSATLSVSADALDLGSNEVYCFVVRVNGTIVVIVSGGPDDFPVAAFVGGVVGGVVVIGVGVAIIIVVLCYCYKKKKTHDDQAMNMLCLAWCCRKREKTHDDQAMKVMSSSSGGASPEPKDPSSAETGEAGPMYQDPNTISRSPHPSTGEVYTDVNLDKKKKAPIEHEVAPGGEVYAMPLKKGKKGKKKKEGEEEEELTKEEKAALYSVPDKKGQKAKSQGLNYADIDLQSSTKPAPPSQGSQYVEVKHN